MEHFLVLMGKIGVGLQKQDVTSIKSPVEGLVVY